MPRFKHQSSGYKLIPVCLENQILPGSFAEAVSELIDHEADLSAFIECYKNDLTGATAFHPKVLLKIILVAYSRGILSSRKIEECCRENVLFMALSGDSQPHFTTIADFITKNGSSIAKLFSQVLLICDKQGLIQRDMFAIDGVKLPSNAAKSKSGTRQDYKKQLNKLEVKIKEIIKSHQHHDQNNLPEKTNNRLEKLRTEAKQLRKWLSKNKEDRKGVNNKIILSNRTDNESGKMATSKGVIQGYTGVAVVDSKHQIVIDAEAHGSGSEQAMLIPALEATKLWRRVDTIMGADSGYHSKMGLKYMRENRINGYIPDNGYRKRDERYATQEQSHKDKPHPLHNKKGIIKKKGLFTNKDFELLPDHSGCICPAGNKLYANGSNCTIQDYKVIKFHGAKQDCVPCELRKECLRKPEVTECRQVAFIMGRKLEEIDELAAMRKKIDSAEGRAIITQRFATVEPVFANIRHNKRMDRFTLRGKKKVDIQWKLYCLVHNIEKLAKNGYIKAA